MRKICKNISPKFSPLQHTIFRSAANPALIVGCYYSIIDSQKRQHDRLLMTLHPEFPMLQFLDNWGVEGFTDLGYAAASHFTQFLVETYGLKKLKEFLSHGIKARNFQTVFDRSKEHLVEDWKSYRDSRQVQLGPPVIVTFRVQSASCASTDTLFLAGDIPELGSWKANGVPLYYLGSETWEGQVTIKSGYPVNYKITRAHGKLND